MESLWLLVVAGGPAIILVVVVLVLMQRRRRYQPDARSPDYEVGGNKYVRDPADKTKTQILTYWLCSPPRIGRDFRIPVF
jgi:hypothetical protein